jgi:hypothetical protein
MPRRSQETQGTTGVAFEDELGQWVRRGLQEWAGSHGPGHEVWARILWRIEHNDLPPARDLLPRGLSSPLTQLLQAVVVSTLLLTFVFGANRGPVWPRRTEAVPGATPVVRTAAASVESQEDMLRGYILMRMEKEHAARSDSHAPGSRIPE